MRFLIGTGVLVASLVLVTSSTADVERPRNLHDVTIVPPTIDVPAPSVLDAAIKAAEAAADAAENTIEVVRQDR